MRTWTKTLTGLLTLTLFALPMGTADAQTLRVKEAKGDAWVSVAGLDPTPTRDAGVRTNVDLVGGKVAHGRRNIVLTVRYADLREHGHVFSLGWSLKTSGKKRFDVSFNEQYGIGEWSLTTARGERVDCFVPFDRSFKKDRISFTVPRACVGNPRWVKASAVTEYCQYCEDRSWDSLGTRGKKPRWTRKVRVG